MYCQPRLCNLLNLDIIFRSVARTSTFAADVDSFTLLLLVFFRFAFLHCVIIVSFNVFGQVITSHESFIADGASESFLARVCSKMSLQLVRTCETFAAKQPVTYKWPLACMPSEMSFKMRRFSVNLTTTGNVTNVLSFLSKRCPSCTESLVVLAVGTVTCRPTRVSPSRPRCYALC